MENTLLQRGIETAKRAAESDRNKDYEQAVLLYLRAVETFRASLVYNKHPLSRKIVQDKMLQYVSRAEEIKRYIESKKQPEPMRAESLSVSSSSTAENKANEGSESTPTSSFNQAIIKEKPNVKWDDVAGLEAAKDALKEAVILPIKLPHLFKGKRKPWRGILLYGPPGTGKSYLAKAVATEADSTFFSVSSSDIMSKWVGESERLVKQLFEAARQSKPSIIFIDEIDSMCGERSEQGTESEKRVKTEFLVQMQGVSANNDGVLVLAATNLPWQLDPAMRRRFEKRIYIPLPEKAARARMFPIHLADTPHKLTAQDYNKLAESTEMFSGSDISILVRDAMMQPVRLLQSATHFKRVIIAGAKESRVVMTPCSPGDPNAVEMTWENVSADQLGDAEVQMVHFTWSLKSMKPSVGSGDLQKYIDWTKQFGQDG